MKNVETTPLQKYVTWLYALRLQDFTILEAEQELDRNPSPLQLLSLLESLLEQLNAT